MIANIILDLNPIFTLSLLAIYAASLAGMKVFKFGGASASTAAGVQNVGEILKRYRGEHLVVVISAMGKTTNALENVVQLFFDGKKDEALQAFTTIKQAHLAVLHELIGDKEDNILTDFFTEVEWLLHDKPVRSFDYYYDQVVCVGELLSTAIVSLYLGRNEVKNTWIDVRDILRTDAAFRDARIDWAYTADAVAKKISPLFAQTDIVLTQGFIGATDENESTTLGREGSDYTAAVFANLLGAESQTIWKDVPGVMNADPKQYPKAEWIKELNYREVIEMAYYGAQVIHPKTVKPLQNKAIPLYVKSFVHPEGEGTVIHNKPVNGLPPIIVNKKDQVLMELFSKDYSFVGEGLTAELYRLFAEQKFKPNLTQNGAISLMCVVDDVEQKVEGLASAAAEYFDVQVQKSLRLLTVRHYNDVIVAELTDGLKPLLVQQTKDTIQLLLPQ